MILQSESGGLDVAAAADDLFSLSEAVGPRRRNRRDDVLKIESLLGNAGVLDFDDDGPLGFHGPDLDEAIRTYQRKRGLVVDGVLEPVGETIRTLRGDLGSRLDGFRSPTLEEVNDHLNRIGRGERPLYRAKPEPLVVHPIPGLPDVGADGHQSHGRIARALFTTRDNSPIARLAADAIKLSGLHGVADVRDLIDQIRERDPGRADALARAVFRQLPQDSRRLFAGGEQRDGPPIAVVATRRSEAVEERAPGDEPRSTEVAQSPEAPRSGARSTPPALRREVFKKQPGVWESFSAAVAKRPGVTPAEEFAIGEIFGVEGGIEIDRLNRTTSSGITPTTLARAKANSWSPGLEKVRWPEQLSIEQRAAIMRKYLDGELREAGGASAWTRSATPMPRPPSPTRSIAKEAETASE